MPRDDRMAGINDVDPFTAVIAGRRHEVYGALARRGPAQRLVLPDGTPAWLITGHAQVREILADARLVKAPSPVGLLARQLLPDLAPALMTHMLQRDPPEHTRLRGLVGAVFTRRRVEQLAPRITEIAEELLDTLETSTEADLISAYAHPLPMTVICELIGVPDDVRADFRDWTAVLAAASFADQAAFVEAVTAEVGFARDLIAQKRSHPCDDLLSALVAVQDGGDQLSDDELTSMVFVLVAAGHETTANLIANGIHALLTHPDRLARLIAEPDLMPTAVEELLRFDSPVQVAFPLVATEPVDIGAVTIGTGEVVLAGLLAGNRDPDRTTEPDELDIGRRPNPHLAFGHGIHHCLGAPLARLEGCIALRSLLQRFPYLRLAVPPDRLTWQPSVLFHGLTALPVVLR